jgi:hypothetical protein
MRANMVSANEVKQAISRIGELERESFALLEGRAALVAQLNARHDAAVLACLDTCFFELALTATVRDRLRTDADYTRLNRELHALDARRNQLQTEAEAARWELMLELVERAETSFPLAAVFGAVRAKDGGLT